MTEEAHNPNQPLSSYEDLRGSARGQAGELWKAADKEEASLGAYYEQLKEDPRFTEEHKAELAWGRYNQAKEKIVEGREKAGEQLASDAATYRRQAIPMPPRRGTDHPRCSEDHHRPERGESHLQEVRPHKRVSRRTVSC
jgi:hypothetical protein